MKQLTLEDLLLYEADLREEQALDDTSDEAIVRLREVYGNVHIHRLSHVYSVCYDDTEYIVEAMDGYDPVILAVIPKV